MCYIVRIVYNMKFLCQRDKNINVRKMGSRKYLLLIGHLKSDRSII